MSDVIILALGGDEGRHVIWLRTLLTDIPVMTSSKIEGIKNLLPIATHVFIRPSSYPWKTHMNLPDHPYIYMVGAAEETTVNNSVLRNFREAKIRDTFIVDDPTDADRLKMLFSPQVIEESQDIFSKPPF